MPVAGYIAGRFGPEVVDRLVDPLLGGVYAGRSEDLSFEATLPGLAQASRDRASLADAAASLLPPRRRQAAPARAGRAGARRAAADVHLAGWRPRLAAGRGGGGVRRGAADRCHGPRAGPHRLRMEADGRLGARPGYLDADAVILALPARPASRLLAGVPGAAAASAGLGEIEYASMAIVTLAYPRAAFPQLPGSSGYLVPAVDGRDVKAVTFSSVKWPHLQRRDGDLIFVRCSVGRIGEEAVLQRDDGDLVALAAADLAAATGVGGAPAGSLVTRWGGALPQYTVGHLDRVARIQASLAGQPGLAACGAAYAGVGIPACIATARAAADQVLAGFQQDEAENRDYVSN